MQWHQKSEIKIEFEKWSNSRFSKLIKNLFASLIFIPEYSCVILIVLIEDTSIVISLQNALFPGTLKLQDRTY